MNTIQSGVLYNFHRAVLRFKQITNSSFVFRQILKKWFALLAMTCNKKTVQEFNCTVFSVHAYSLKEFICMFMSTYYNFYKPLT